MSTFFRRVANGDRSIPWDQYLIATGFVAMWIFLAFIFISIAVSISKAITEQQNTYTEEQLVEKGVGEYYIDDDDQLQFRFIEEDQ